MSRNLYILAATFFGFALLCFAMTFTSSPYQIGLPANGSLWKVMGFVLLLGSLLTALAGVLRRLYEQVEDRAIRRELREIEREFMNEKPRSRQG